MTASQALGKIMYEKVAQQQAAAGGAAGPAGETVGASSSEAKDDNVIDAEFEVKEDDK